jgi:hypothetical protein
MLRDNVKARRLQLTVAMAECPQRKAKRKSTRRVISLTITALRKSDRE